MLNHAVKYLCAIYILCGEGTLISLVHKRESAFPQGEEMLRWMF